MSKIMSKIQAYHALAATIRAEANSAPDKIQSELHIAVLYLEKAIHRSRAQSRADLNIKIGIWTELIDDPASILDEHREYWKTFMADVSLLMEVSEYPERYSELEAAE